MPTKPATSIRFHGSPRMVEALTPLSLQKVLTSSITLDIKTPSLAQRTRPLNLQSEPVGLSNTRLRFSLPESTPPGIYEGTMLIEGQIYPINVEVVPHSYLVILPRQLSLELPPSREAIVDLMLANSGNVPCEIAKVYAFGIFDVDGAERSIGAAFRDSAAKGQGRLDRLLDEAADNHGGLVRVNIREGAGIIDPGAQRELRAALRFSDRLKPGHTYSGTWPLFNLKYYVRISVPGSKPAAVDGTIEEAS